MSKNQKPLVLTVNEAAEIIRCGRLKIIRLIETGELEAQRVGGEWRIRTESVEKIVGSLDKKYE